MMKKLLLICLFLIGCTNHKMDTDYFTHMSDEQQLFEWLYNNSHRFQNHDIDYGNILKNIKNKIAPKDYYLYQVLIFNEKEINIEYLEKADELGNADAGEYIYKYYYPNDHNKKFKFLKSSANKGNVYAQFILGGLYFYGGRDIKINKEKGVELLQLSAWGGSSRAVLSLGDIKVKPYLKTDEFQFWRVINGLFEHDEENEDKVINIDVELSKITNKPQFCTKYKQYVLNNIIPHKDYYSNIYPNLLKVLGGCMTKEQKLGSID